MLSTKRNYFIQSRMVSSETHNIPYVVYHTSDTPHHT